MRIMLFDRCTYKPTSREYTDEGYLRVPGRVARTGIQKYLASDLEITDRKPDDIVVVYRPPEEVFSADSLASYSDADVVNDHPENMVDADSFKRVTVGHVSGPATQDGDYIVANLIIKDASAIKSVESGKAELSAGYEAEYIPEPGITEDGQKYEFVQRDIKINHVALVDKARAGPRARLFDNELEGSMTTLTLGGRTVEVADSATATLIADIFDRKDEENAKMKTRLEELDEDKEKAEAEKDAKDEELKKEKEKTSDAAISSRVADLVKVTADAKRVAGKEFVADGVDALAIKRAALAKFRDSVDWPKMSDAYVCASFDMAVEEKEKESEDDDDDEKKAKKSQDGFAKDMADNAANQTKESPRQKFSDGITNGWKATVGDA